MKVRVDMIQFVTANSARYNWDAHLYLKMHGLNLDSWIQKMMFWTNDADGLAIYALSDMLGIHTTVLTKNEPWTTISWDYQGDMNDLLHISAVSLVYLGKDRFASLWKKTSPSGNSFVGPNFNYAPMVNPPVAPSADNLTTAQALLELHGDEPESEDPNQGQKPTIFTELLDDAMDKVVEHLDTCPTGQLTVIDAMDSILASTESNITPVLHVETITPTSDPNLLDGLHVETKPCSVNLTRLEFILADDLFKVTPTAASDLPIGEHFTRSRSTHTPKRTGRKPRRVSTGVKYGETSSVDDMPIPDKPKPKPSTAKPNRSSPSADRINSRNKSSVAPTVRLPPIKTEHTDVPDKDKLP